MPATPRDISEQVSRRIRELRDARGLSLRELARRAGLAPESVSRSERGVNEVSLTNLDRICRGLGVTVAAFFAFEGQGSVQVQLPEEARRAAALVDALPEKRRRRVVEALELLLTDGSPRATSRGAPRARAGARGKPPSLEP